MWKIFPRFYCINNLMFCGIFVLNVVFIVLKDALQHKKSKIRLKTIVDIIVNKIIFWFLLLLLYIEP